MSARNASTSPGLMPGIIVGPSQILDLGDEISVRPWATSAVQEPMVCMTLCWREMDSNHRFLARKSRFLLWKANCGDRTGVAKKGCFLCGTDGSNPSPSRGESSANRAGCHDGFGERPKIAETAPRARRDRGRFPRHFLRLR